MMALFILIICPQHSLSLSLYLNLGVLFVRVVGADNYINNNDDGDKLYIVERANVISDKGRNNAKRLLHVQRLPGRYFDLGILPKYGDIILSVLLSSAYLDLPRYTYQTQPHIVPCWRCSGR